MLPIGRGACCSRCCPCWMTPMMTARLRQRNSRQVSAAEPSWEAVALHLAATWLLPYEALTVCQQGCSAILCLAAVT